MDRKWVVQPWHDEGEGYREEPSTPRFITAPTKEQAREEFYRVDGRRNVAWLTVLDPADCTDREGRRLLRACEREEAIQ